MQSFANFLRWFFCVAFIFSFQINTKRAIWYKCYKCINDISRYLFVEHGPPSFKKNNHKVLNLVDIFVCNWNIKLGCVSIDIFVCFFFLHVEFLEFDPVDLLIMIRLTIIYDMYYLCLWFSDFSTRKKKKNTFDFIKLLNYAWNLLESFSLLHKSIFKVMHS